MLENTNPAKNLQNFLEDAREKNKLPLLAIIGPTASGKTALSLALAKKFNGEIISADSRQVYKYMDIGTAKILPEDQQNIPHHLLDIVEPDQNFSLAEYKRLTEEKIEEILQRNKLPILVGGTGLYISAVTENYDLPKAPPKQSLRKKMEKIAEIEGPEALHKILSKLDPLSASKIHPHNVRYVVRAIEIAEIQKSPKEDKKHPSPYQTYFLGIEWPRTELYQHINKRIDEQMRMGFLREVKALLGMGYNDSMSALNTLGYKELIQHLKGEISLEEAIDLMKQHTRNYAKRQLTWFRRYKNVHWLPGEKLMGILQNLE